MNRKHAKISTIGSNSDLSAINLLPVTLERGHSRQIGWRTQKCLLASEGDPYFNLGSGITEGSAIGMPCDELCKGAVNTAYCAPSVICRDKGHRELPRLTRDTGEGAVTRRV